MKYALLILLLPLVAGQDSDCPTTFPPEECQGEAEGTTPEPPPPNCGPCFTIDDMSAAMGAAGVGTQNCQIVTGGATQFLQMSAAGPPIEIVGVYVTFTDGSCSREDLLTAEITFPAGTLSAADLAGRCKDTLEYWTLTVPNEVCESVS